jgi:ferredoxin
LKRLRVNPILCDGAAFCAEIAPELVWLDEWGFPVVDSRGLDECDTVLRHARRAVAVCPRQALRLENLDPTRSR